MPDVTITKEFLDSLPEKDILMIRDYIWARFGNKPVQHKTAVQRESKSDMEAALRRR